MIDLVLLLWLWSSCGVMAMSFDSCDRPGAPPEAPPYVTAIQEAP